MTASRKYSLLFVGVFAGLAAGAGVYWAVTRESPQVDVPPHSHLEIPDGPAWFRDITAESGIDFTYRNGEEANEFTILESLGGGVAMIDYDNDGLLDLFFTGGGRFDGQKIIGLPCRLYQNLGGCKFRDVTKDVGLDKIDFYTHGVAVADYNKDGFPDLLVTGYGRVALFRNDEGKRFVDVTESAGLSVKSWSTSAGFADLTGSGYPDLYICNYVDWSFTNHPTCKGKGTVARDVCEPERFKPLVHTLYRNLGNGIFRDITKEQRLRNDGAGLGVVLADFDGSGRPGIYVANDGSGIGNHLYLVGPDGKLEDRSSLAGVARSDMGYLQGSMGVDAADYDGSGRASLFVSNFQAQIHGLYQNLGQGVFNYQSRSTGLAALKRDFVGFGASFLDIDNDGWEDLILVNGHVLRYPENSTYKQQPVLLRNTPLKDRRVFADWSKRGGSHFATPAVARGLAVGDLDNDGWPDVVVNNTNSPVVLLRNVAFDDKPARWLGVKLVGKGYRDVAGATVTLETDGPKLTRFVKGGASYLSSGDRRIVFGLGSSGKPGRLTVKWPRSDEQVFDNLDPGAYWELCEGVKAPHRIEPTGQSKPSR